MQAWGYDMALSACCMVCNVCMLDRARDYVMNSVCVIGKRTPVSRDQSCRVI